MLVFLLFFTQRAAALTQDFYLKRVAVPEKLLPNTLSCTVTVGKSQNFFVDILPREAKTDVLWTISPAIATVSQKNHQCIVTATRSGEAILTAYADNGISCKIKIKALPPSPQIRLEGSDTIMSGENTVIKAITSNDEPVTWHIKSPDDAKVSYGGNICKIKPGHRGTITVSASLGDTTVSKTLTVLSPEKNGINLNLLGGIMGVLGAFLLGFVFIYGRKYEREV